MNTMSFYEFRTQALEVAVSGKQNHITHKSVSTIY